MQTRFCALALGVFYLAFGILGLIPALYSTAPAGAPTVDATASYGYLFGVFPVNLVQDLLNIALGLVGIVAGSRFDLARLYCMTLFILLGVVACFGFVPALDTLGGDVPIWSNDTWVHVGTAIIAGYFGYVAPESTHVEPAVGHAH